MSRNKVEMVARARHHAEKLSPLARMYSDMKRVIRVKDLKTRVQLKTKNKTYLIRPIHLDGQRYNGIEIKRARSKESVKLMVVL